MRIQLGLVLRDYRKKNKMSAKSVVDRLPSYGIEISEKTLYSYETGYRMPDADTLMSLCEIYQINNIMETFGYKVNDDKEDSPANSGNVSDEAMEVACAYDGASLKDRNTARMALNLHVIDGKSQVSKTSKIEPEIPEFHIPDFEKISKEAQEIRKAVDARVLLKK